MMAALYQNHLLIKINVIEMNVMQILMATTNLEKNVRYVVLTVSLAQVQHHHVSAVMMD